MSSGREDLGAGLARELDRLLAIASSFLADVEGTRRLPADLQSSVRTAANRVARARRLLDDGVPTWLSGLTIHDGAHVYLSTYCQHATALEAARGSDTLTEALHHACRQTCKICQASCRCAAVGCPCHTTRNRSNVVPENPTPEKGDPMGPRDRAERDEHGEHKDDQPGQPRPRQDPDAQREHYEREAGEATGENN